MAFYLFPGVMYQRFKEADKENRNFYAKGREDTNYSKITNPYEYTQEYIGTTKEALYSEDRDEVSLGKVVTIRGSSEKITSTASLLAIVSLFRANNKIAKYEPAAIEKAMSVLSLN